MHYFFFGLFSYSYTLSVTVLTLWVALPKMFYSWYLMEQKPIVELRKF